MGGDPLTLAPASTAVDFTLPSTTGTTAMGALRGRPLLLSFYSMAFTPT